MLEKAKHEFITTFDAKIHAVSMGEEVSEPPFLLLHGFPDFYYGFRYLIPILAQEGEVVAIDQRGYNKSSKPKNVEDYRLELLMKDVREVIEQKFSSERVILVGHDWGGAISWHFARSYPDFVEKLVILNCPPIDLLFKSFVKIPKQLFMSFYIFLFQLPIIPKLLFKVNDYALLKRLYRTVKIRGEPISEEEVQEYVKCFKRQAGFSGINYYRAAFMEVLKGDIKLDSKVKCPTLVLWGTEDFALHPKLTDYFNEYVGEGKLEIKYYPVGHFIQQEIPSKIGKEILDFSRKKRKIIGER